MIAPKLGPVPCQGCGAPVLWIGVNRLVRAWREAGHRKVHACPGPRCGAFMPVARERCARKAGHRPEANGTGHRTRYAMDNQARSKRSGWAA